MSKSFKASILLMGIIFILLIASTSVFADQIGIANPAAVYCEKLGYKYNAEKEVCIIEKSIEYDAWDFFEGKVGQQYSYCSKLGYDIETVKDGKNQYSREYSICVIKKSLDTAKTIKERRQVTELMNLSKSSIKNLVKIEDISSLIKEINPIDEKDLISEPVDYEVSAPSYFDWRNVNSSNWLTSVKDQGSCGSCWAFATVGAIESKIKIVNSNSSLDKDLSEQDLVSCFAGDGCNGILDSEFPSMLSYIKNNGIVEESCFPYSAFNEPCSDKCPTWKNGLWHIDDYGGISNVSKTKDYLVAKGPIIALIGMSGYFDSNGTYRCLGSPSIDHAVLIVGYNDTGGYWIVKNSWGNKWNGNGYFNIGYDECSIIPSYYILGTSYYGQGSVGSNYCSVASKNSNYEIIVNVSLNGNERTSGRSNYSDFTNTTLTNLTLGNNYTLYVTVNASTQSNPNEFVKTWIDFNNDNMFSDNETIDFGNFTFLGKHTYSKNFTVPNNANVGETRMRVYLKWRSAPVPCENASYGEVEDYKVGILSPYQNNTLTSCSILNQSGSTYYLKNDIIDSNYARCMDIVADNITLDCEGHKIDGNKTLGTFGVSSSYYNITIKNCYISDWEYGINCYSNMHGVLYNNIANFNVYGITLSNSLYNILSNNIANSNNDTGISLDVSVNGTLSNNIANSNNVNGIALGFSNNTVIYNNTANSNGDKGIYLDYSPNNTLSNNTANSNNYGIFLLGNLWGSYNTLSNNTANSNRIEGIDISYSSINTISNNIANSNTWGIGIYSSNNVIISNNKINSNAYQGIEIYSSVSTISNNVISSNGIGINLSSSNNNLISNNVISSNDIGIGLWFNSSNNTIYNDTANSNIYGILFQYSPNNTVNENIVCENTYSDFSIFSSTGNSGANNKCENPDGWSDDGFVGCTYSCTPPLPILISINSPLNSSVLNESSVWFNLTTSRNSTCSHSLIRCSIFDGGGGCGGTSAINMSTNDSIHHSAFVTSLTNTAANEWYQLGANCTDYKVSNTSDVIFFVNITPPLVNRWTVNLSIDLDNIKQGIWEFGMSDNATDLFDSGTDDTSPPANPSGFDAYFNESEPTPKDRLSIDIKSMTEEKNWTFTVTTPKQQTVKITWNSSIDTNLTLKIGEIDPNTGNYIGEVLNMKYYDSISFSGGANWVVTKVYRITAFKSSYKTDVLNLDAGWNLVSIPYVLENNSVQNVFNDKVKSVWTYENGVWYIWVPGIGGTLKTIEPKKGYWVNTDESKIIVFEGNDNANHTIPLYNGWNLIGVTRTVSLPLSNPYIVGSIWGWAGNNYVSVADSLEPKEGYWVAVSENTTLEE